MSLLQGREKISVSNHDPSTPQKKDAGGLIFLVNILLFNMKSSQMNMKVCLDLLKWEAIDSAKKEKVIKGDSWQKWSCTALMMCVVRKRGAKMYL